MNNAATIFETDQLPEFFAKRDVVFVYIDGDKIDDKKLFFQEVALKMRFPAYFGFNWDAFRDCITDLSWLPIQDGLVLIYKNPYKFMSTDPEQWNTANQILIETITFWNDKNIPMFIMYI
jgi:RNAse (barnase) inhibitor barstar